MIRAILILGVVLVSTTCALGDVIVSRGETMQLWLSQGTGPSMSLSFGYRMEGGSTDPTTIIGDDIWFSMPGTYDLSLDAQFPVFLEWATNGQRNHLKIRLADQHDVEDSIPIYEGLVFGHYPDLAPLVVTGAQLEVEQMYPEPGGFMVVMHLEFLGIPEPATILLFAVIGGLGFRA